MAGEKLTKRVVDALKAPEPSKVGVKVRESFVWDRELRGFGVQVMPSGLKSFVIQYRPPDGRQRRAVIGRYGLMTVEEARTVAHEKLVAVFDVDGDDPARTDVSVRRKGSLLDQAIARREDQEALLGKVLRRRQRHWR